MENDKVLLVEKKVLVLGDYEDAPYHPLTHLEELFQEVLSECDVKCTNDREELKNLDCFDLFLCYVDSWNKKLDTEYLADLLSYVAKGGKMLVLHNGIAYQDHYEFACLVGARFISHPDRQEITFTMVGDHELIEGLEPFVLYEEPYQFEMIGQNREEWKATILMEYEMDGCKYPAAWIRNYGAGKVCYFMPGHDVSVFENTKFQKVLKQMVELL